MIMMTIYDDYMISYIIRYFWLLKYIFMMPGRQATRMGPMYRRTAGAGTGTHAFWWHDERGERGPKTWPRELAGNMVNDGRPGL